MLSSLGSLDFTVLCVIGGQFTRVEHSLSKMLWQLDSLLMLLLIKYLKADFQSILLFNTSC